jgi:anti-anti-sigma factor
VELIFEVQGRNEKLILSCRGQLVCGNEADALQITFCRLLASTRHITLDLHNVRKMDCAGLGAIVACMTLARQQGKTFDLCFVPSHISNMIRVTGLYRVLHVAEQKSASSVGVCAA